MLCLQSTLYVEFSHDKDYHNINYINCHQKGIG